MSLTNVSVSRNHAATVSSRTQRPTWLDEELYPHDLFKSVTKSHDYLVDLEQRLSEIKEMPALLIFGDQDATIKMGWLARLECIFPRHRTIIMKGSHHFPQIYDSAAVASTIRSFWDEEIAA
jgi:pimeloyl-ACP methyl ester carboxylesterase